jgi:hydroxypyruvate isomerase
MTPMPAAAWNLRYAPHIGRPDPATPFFAQSAASRDPVDQIAYIAELGFAGVLDNYCLQRSPDEQRRIGRALEKKGLEMSSFVLRADPVAAAAFWGLESAIETLEGRVALAIEAARRVNGRRIVVTSPCDPTRPRAWQMAGMVKTLRQLVPMLEKAGIQLCIESVNAPRMPDRLLHHIGDAYLVATGADSDAVRIVYDVVHVQVMDGDLIANVDRYFDKIASFQLAELSRNEPGSGGEINWVGLLGHIRKRGFRGLLDLEHGCEFPGKAGEQKALERLRAIDAQL